MNNEQKNRWGIALALLFLLMGFNGCIPNQDIPSPSQVTKAQRTALGTTIRDVLSSDTIHFSVLSKDNPTFISSFNYLQQLYNQAYYLLRDDWNAPDSDKWDVNRLWEVFILDTPEKMAFCLPGGDFFITSGLLKSLDYEYELYYIMCFESVIMHHRYLLNELISSANNTADLLQIIDTGISNSKITIEDLTNKLVHEISYTEDGMIKDIDRRTHELICASSLFNRFAILPILSRLNSSDAWLYMRPSYEGRANFISSELEVENLSSCGNKKWSSQSADYDYFINLLP